MRCVNRGVLLSGVADIDIRKETLSMEGIMEKLMADVIALVEAKGTHCNISISSLSEYCRSNHDNQKQARRSLLTRSDSPYTRSPFNQSMTAKCLDCSYTFRLYTKKARGIFIPKNDVKHVGKREPQNCQGLQDQSPTTTMMIPLIRSQL